MSGEVVLNWPAETGMCCGGYEVGSIWREARMPATHEIASLVWGDLPSWMPTPIRAAVDWPWPPIRLHPGRLVPDLREKRPTFVVPVFGRTGYGPTTTLALYPRSAGLSHPAIFHDTQPTILGNEGERDAFTLRRYSPLNGVIILTAGVEAWLWWSMMSIRPVWAAPRWYVLTETDLSDVSTVLLAPDRGRDRIGLEATTDMLRRRFAGRVRVEPIWTPEEANRWGLLAADHVALRPLYGRDGW
jgi:hypothetical protein